MLIYDVQDNYIRFFFYGKQIIVDANSTTIKWTNEIFLD